MCTRAFCPPSTWRASTWRVAPPVLLPPQPIGRRRASTRRIGWTDHHRRARHGPGELRPGAPSGHRRTGGRQPRARRVGDRADSRRRMRRGMPLLGICRGAQVVNVALGGTLHQHLPDVIGHSQPSAGQRGVLHIGGAHCARHPAGRVDRRDVGCAVLPPPGDRPLGDGLVVSAQDADGVIEARRDTR